MSRRPEHPHTRTRKQRLTGMLAGPLMIAVALTGCVGTEPDDDPQPSDTTSQTPVPSVTPSATPTGPALVPDGEAADNLPFFASVVAAVSGTPDSVSGRAYVDALAAAGFDKAAMQLTPDQSTVGNAAESIQFSIRWGDECLVGQVGPATGVPVTVVLPALAEGACLIGQTRPIDW